MEPDEKCSRCGGDIRRKSGSLFHCVACRRLYVTFVDPIDFGGVDLSEFASRQGSSPRPRTTRLRLVEGGGN